MAQIFSPFLEANRAGIWNFLIGGPGWGGSGPGCQASFLVCEAAGEGENSFYCSQRHGKNDRALVGRLMQAAMREASQRGAEEMFLEVDEINQAQLHLQEARIFQGGRAKRLL